jgi:hypothetical protein
MTDESKNKVWTLLSQYTYFRDIFSSLQIYSKRFLGWYIIDIHHFEYGCVLQYQGFGFTLDRELFTMLLRIKRGFYDSQ